LIRVGIIGCGYWGPNLVRSFSEIEGVELAKVSDLREGRRDFIARRYPSLQATTNPDEILSDSSIDAVVVATPPSTHTALAIEALERGKHVLVEKPLATSTADAQKIVSVAAERKLVLAVGHLFLYAPAVQQISECIRRGELGTVYSVSSVRCNLGPPNTQIDVLWDLGPHDVSVILYLMNASPVEIFSQGANFTGTKFAETVFSTLRFDDGRIAHIHVSWLTPAKTRLMQIIGSRRVAVYDDMQPIQKVQIYDPGIDNRVDAPDKDSAQLGFSPGGIWIPPLKSIEPLRAECEDFIQCIRNGGTPISNGDRALDVVRVLESASRRLEQGGQSSFIRAYPGSLAEASAK